MKKDIEKLIHKLIQKIDSNPKVAKNYYELAEVLLDGHNYEQAEELLGKARGLFKQQRDLDLIDYGLGNVYYSSGLYDKAIATFSQIKNKKLANEINIMLAQTYYAKEEYQKAFAYALTAFEKDTDNGDILELMGDIYFALGQMSEAKNEYDEALKHKKTAKLLFNRGVIEMYLVKQNNNRFFDEAKKLDEKYFNAQKQRLIDIDKSMQARNKKHGSK